jgi:hypothetical protein
MKIIKTTNRLEFVVENDEAENVISAFGKQSIVLLRSGAYLNPSTIAAIIDPPKIAYWAGYRVCDDGKSIFRDGVKTYLEPRHLDEIEYRDDPKYLNSKLIENAS